MFANRSMFAAAVAAGDGDDQYDHDDGDHGRHRVNAFTFTFDNIVVNVSTTFWHNVRYNSRCESTNFTLIDADGQLRTANVQPSVIRELLGTADDERFSKLNAVLHCADAVTMRQVNTYVADLEANNNISGYNVRKLVSGDGVTVYTGLKFQNCSNIMASVSVVVSNSAATWLDVVRLVRLAREQLDPTMHIVTFNDVITMLDEQLVAYVDAEYLLIDDTLYVMDGGRPLALSFDCVELNMSSFVFSDRMFKHIKHIRRTIGKRQCALAGLEG